MRVPGQRLRALVVAYFDQATAERILLPAIADLQHELAETRGRSRPARAFARLCAYAAFWRAFGLCLASRSDQVHRVVRWQTILGGAAVFAVSTPALTLQPLLRVRRDGGGWSLALLLLPSAVAVTLPLSALGAGLVATRFRRIAERRRPFVRPVVTYGAVATALSFVVMAWAVPSANQAYRVQAYQAFRAWSGVKAPPSFIPTKGYPEMTMGELRDARRRAVLQARWEQAEQASYYVHLKGAIPAAALAFGLATLALAPARRRPRFPILGGVLLGCLTAFVYYVLMYVFRAQVWAMAVPAWLGAWAPPLAFSAMATTVMVWRTLATTNDERRTNNDELNSQRRRGNAF